MNLEFLTIHKSFITFNNKQADLYHLCVLTQYDFATFVKTACKQHVTVTIKWLHNNNL